MLKDCNNYSTIILSTCNGSIYNVSGIYQAIAVIAPIVLVFRTSFMVIYSELMLSCNR